MSDYFSLFGMKASYQLDLIELATRYRDLQRAVHPDRHANSADNEKLLSLTRAAELNDAYQTLKDPVLRAKYLWQQKAGRWQDERTIADPAFLLAQIEWREQIEEAEHNADALQSLSQQLRQEQRLQESRVASLFTIDSSFDSHKARLEIQKLMFFRKLQQETEQRLEALEEI